MLYNVDHYICSKIIDQADNLANKTRLASQFIIGTLKQRLSYCYQNSNVMDELNYCTIKIALLQF